MSAPGPGRWLLVAAGAVIVATVAAAIVVMGTPGAQRQARMDERRIEDLRGIEAAVRLHRAQTGALPRNLDALARPGLALDLEDPVSAARYAFRVTGPDTFELCASFATDTATRGSGAWPAPQDLDWAHGAGTSCFTRRITPATNADGAP